MTNIHYIHIYYLIFAIFSGEKKQIIALNKEKIIITLSVFLFFVDIYVF